MDNETTVMLCEACGQEDTIYFTSDCGVCMECGTPENYTEVQHND